MKQKIHVTTTRKFFVACRSDHEAVIQPKFIQPKFGAKSADCHRRKPRHCCCWF